MFRKPTHKTCVVVNKKNYIVTTNDWEYSRKLASIDQISNGVNNSTDSIIYHNSNWGLWSLLFKTKQLIRNFTRLFYGVLIISCFQRIVHAAKCYLRRLTETECSEGKTRLFQEMLSRQHEWGDLKWGRISTLIARFMGPTWGPSAADRTLLSGHHRFCPLTTAWILSITRLTFYPVWAAS